MTKINSLFTPPDDFCCNLELKFKLWWSTVDDNGKIWLECLIHPIQKKFRPILPIKNQEMDIKWYCEKHNCGTETRNEWIISKLSSQHHVLVFILGWWLHQEICFPLWHKTGKNESKYIRLGSFHANCHHLYFYLADLEPPANNVITLSPNKLSHAKYF